MEFEYRVEIISNQSVEDEIIDLMEKEIVDLEYTILPAVHGKGLKSRKLASNIWPEQNFVLFAYVDKANAQKIKAIVTAIKKRFPREGISLFFTKAEAL